jgi:nucleotide-binding universal stress UspA family protein
VEEGRSTVFKNILVAVDGSKSSTNALETAAELAASSGGKLHILHVVREMQVPLTPGLMEVYEKLQRDRHDLLNSAGEQLINQAKRSVEAKGLDAVETDIGSGDPASAIVDYSARNKIDLIVMGSRGLGQVEGMLMGSVSRKVSNTTKTNCLIIK